jgi:hypothetical protein
MDLAVRIVHADGIEDWTTWSPDDPDDVFQWFTICVSMKGSDEEEMYRTVIATPKGAKREVTKGSEFKGFVMPKYEAARVHTVIQQFVGTIFALDWSDVAEELVDNFVSVI